MQGVETLLTETRQLLNIDDSVHQVLPIYTDHTPLPCPRAAWSVWPAYTTMPQCVAWPGAENRPPRHHRSPRPHQSCHAPNSTFLLTYASPVSHIMHPLIRPFGCAHPPFPLARDRQARR